MTRAPESSDTPRRVLLIAFHFPPFAQSSGLLRTFCFARDLLALGWQSIVLTVTTQVYENSRDDLYRSGPACIIVERATAWDAACDFAIGGRYPDWIALPDRWWSWLLGAAVLAWRRWRRWRVDVMVDLPDSDCASHWLVTGTSLRATVGRRLP